MGKSAELYLQTMEIMNHEDNKEEIIIENNNFKHRIDVLNTFIDVQNSHIKFLENLLLKRKNN